MAGADSSRSGVYIHTAGVNNNSKPSQGCLVINPNLLSQIRTIPKPDAAQAEQDPSHARRTTSAMGADRVQNLVYAVTLKPLRADLKVDGNAVPLGPGMEVTTEIRTGSRRIIDYLFSPLAKTTSEAIRER